jgi:PAS domain S-box-containing protein
MLEYRILIIDDSKVSAKIISRFILDNGLNATSQIISSKNEIIEKLSNNIFDIIILDFYLEDYNAFDALKIIRQINPDIPVIVISGMKDDNIAAEVMDAGAGDFIRKDNLSRLIPAIKREYNNYKIKIQKYHAEDKLNHLNKLDDSNSFYEKKSFPDQNDNEYNPDEFQNFLKTNKLETDFVFYSILENIPCKIFISRVEDQKTIFANSQFYDFFTTSQDEIYEQKSDAFLNNKSAQLLKKYQYEVLKTKKAIDLKFLNLIDKNGIQHFVNTHIYSIRNRDNQEFLVNIFIDIIDLKESINKNINLENKFFKLFQFIPIPTVITRLSDNMIIDSNDAFYKMTGYSKDEIIGNNNKFVDIWQDVEVRKEIIENAIKHKNKNSIDTILIKKNGEKVHIMVYADKIEFNNEIYLIFIGLDITEKKNIINQLEENLKKEKELNLIRNHFVSLISHEYRTPLTSIMLSVDILKRYSEQWKKEDRDKQLQRIQDTVMKMTQMMENVLILSNIDSGELGFNPDKFNLKSFCLSIARNVEIIYHNKVIVNFIYVAKSEEYKLDENLIGLIISNILNNAVKYSISTKNDVEFKIYNEEDNIIFEVKDNGIGIPKNDFPNIFKEFSRASNTANIAGYGLGLAITKRAVESQNGKIIIESTENKGTNAKVIIPVIN